MAIHSDLSDIRALRATATARLTDAGVDAPRLCAELLLARVLGWSKLDLILRTDYCPTPAQLDALDALLARRAQGEPLAYILDTKAFFGRDFIVTPATLIPRPETECVVEAILTACQSPQFSVARFVDIGAGSGCIGITLALERPDWRGCLLDISAPALDIARANVRQHGVGDRVSRVRGDLTRLGLATGVWDIVVSNPPYVSAAEYAQLDPTVRDYEPRTALVPGESYLQALAINSARLLTSGGLCCVEHGAGHGSAVRQFFARAGFWEDIRTGRDMAGLERYCLCRRK